MYSLYCAATVFNAIRRLACLNQVSKAWISNYIPQVLWDVITYPCPRYPHLAHKFPDVLICWIQHTLTYLWQESEFFYRSHRWQDPTIGSTVCIVTWSSGTGNVGYIQKWVQSPEQNSAHQSLEQHPQSASNDEDTPALSTSSRRWELILP